MAPPTAKKRSTVTPKKPAAALPRSKQKPRPNASILSFFQKAEKEEEELFIQDRAEKSAAAAAATPTLHNGHGGEGARFNEVGGPVKKRRLSGAGVLEGAEDDKENVDGLFGSDVEDVEDVLSREENKDEKPPSVDEVMAEPDSATHRVAKDKPPVKAPAKRKGPFLDDSDSEDESDPAPRQSFAIPPFGKTVGLPPAEPAFEGEEPKSPEKETSCPPPRLKQDDSLDTAFANMDGYEKMDDFPDDEDLGGEEFRMMRYMEEQSRLEMEVMKAEDDDFYGDALRRTDIANEAKVANCPICDGSLLGLSTDDATKHVNACLDGNPIPLPKPKSAVEPVRQPRREDSESTNAMVDAPELGKRFQRAAVPRAPQANPFDIVEGETAGAMEKKSSAFTQLMSGHAESAAWANAAAADKASRGKAAYERTCPFYKIMPGFNICVDAFRYGAVKGCQAYFLSHFHSDHYIGLTAHWTHGPIYCSKVTGDLCIMQLKVAPKWIVALDFEETVEVPGTGGVMVTMIPANHCPGSSLFLFEKPHGKGANVKKQRYLHCGDFRACPAHVEHPLLKPDVQDAITGKLKQQRIDLCYLDTTYLNPRYSFPPQEDVIRTCADVCAGISPDPNCTTDIWDIMARKGGNGSVSKFFIKPPSPVKEESDTTASGSAKDGTADFFTNVKEKKPPTCRQRLLVICGTYSIGKERICIAIARALKTKIFASPAKIRICSKLGDPELTSLLTSDPLEAQVHMQMLMEIRAETLQDYLDSYRPHFSRIVGFRPSGWSYRPAPASTGATAASLTSANTAPGTVATTQILHSMAWRSRFTAQSVVPQRGSTREAMCFGVPYSEHSSFRELAMFVMALRIDKVIPTVNVGSEQSRKRMKSWIDRWMAERRRGGLVRALVEGEGQKGEGEREVVLWEGKDSSGGGAWW
ncbi:hypothetical protein VDGD_04259 [Verticillium dahliae]|nr:hypothetical protein VDGD_04259 [Verticillium dahliae]